MDDYSWFDGSDSDYGDSGFDWDSWGSGDSLGDYGGDYGSNASDFNTSDPASNYQWASDNNDYGALGYNGNNSAASGGTGINWGSMVGPGLTAAGNYLGAMAQGQMSADQLKLAEQLAEKQYAFKLAEDEKYYQSHGKQLSDAYQKYKGAYINPNDPANKMHRETNIFGLLTPHPTTGPLANGW